VNTSLVNTSLVKVPAATDDIYSLVHCFKHSIYTTSCEREQ